jgi:glycine/D-amino acid oxidase-like deaminating enzyme
VEAASIASAWIEVSSLLTSKNMRPAINHVETDRALPTQADVVVIGGGVIGLTTTLFLAERGVQVVLVEKGEIACEQSSRNWGWCRQTGRDPREFDLIRESLRLWQGMNERCQSDTGFQTTGILYAARSDTDEAGYRDWVDKAARSGIKARLVNQTELADLLPGDRDLPQSALYCDSDGRAEPQWAGPAFAQAARRLGAAIFTQCAARGIDTTGGQVSGVVTERGVVSCKTVVVAGGAWSRRILKDLNVSLPQLKVRASVARTTVVENGPVPALWDGPIAFRKRADGGYTIADGSPIVVPLTPDSFRYFFHFMPMLKMEWRGLRLKFNQRFFTEWDEAAPVPWDQPSPFEKTRMLDPEPDVQYLNRLMRRLKDRYPAFRNASIAQSWAGFIDATPDAVPVISEVDKVSGLIIATGFSGHGFGISPGAGHLVADMACGLKPIADPREFRLSRFFDGSAPQPVSGV